MALTLSSAPISPLATIRAAARTCGERLPGKAMTSSRPVRSRVAISASASAAFMTIGFSRRTSTPASRQAVVWAAWKTCGVMMKTTSSSGANRSTKRVQSGSFGGVGRPIRLNSVAVSSSAVGGRLADRDDDRVLAWEHVPEVAAGHRAHADDANANRVTRHVRSLSKRADADRSVCRRPGLA